MSTGVRRLSEETLREFGVTARMTIGGHLEDARREFQEAKEVARRNNEGEIYAWLSGRIGEIDGMRAALADEEAS